MERILIATDFSAAARNATHYGVKLAKYFNADIVLVNAYPLPPTDYETGFSVEMIKSLRQTGEEGLEQIRKDILSKNKEQFDVICEVEMGIPRDVIMTAAKKYNVDLIVMGIVGEAGAMKEHLIGSSSVDVARTSEIPTIIVPEKAEYHPIHKMAFACDLNKTEESDIIYITKYFAQVFDAELDVVYVENPSEEVTVEKSKSSVFVEKRLESVKHRTVYSTSTDAAEGLVEYLREHPCNLVITNPKKHSFFHNLFNESFTKKIAFRLTVPILAIR